MSLTTPSPAAPSTVPPPASGVAASGMGRAPGAWPCSPSCPSCGRSPVWPTRTTRATSTSTPGGSCASRRRCGTRRWASAPSPTSRSATSSPWAPSSGPSSALGVPLWVGQRLWVGAGAVRRRRRACLYLCRTVRLEGPGPFVAAVAYMLSPYWLQDLGRSGVLDPALGGAGMDGRLRHPRRAPGRVALPGAVRPGLVHASAASTPAARSTRRWRPLLWLLYAVFVVQRAHPAPGVGDGVADRRAHRRGVVVVGVCARHRVRLRPQRPRDHREGLRRGEDGAVLGGAAGPGLLVLLRVRHRRPVGGHLGGVHPAAVAHRRQLRRADPGAGGRRRRPVAPPRLLHPPHRGGDGPGRRVPSLRGAVDAWAGSSRPS